MSFTDNPAFDLPFDGSFIVIIISFWKAAWKLENNERLFLFKEEISNAQRKKLNRGQSWVEPNKEKLFLDVEAKQ